MNKLIIEKEARKLIQELLATDDFPVSTEVNHRNKPPRLKGGGPPPPDIFPNNGDSGGGKFAPYGWIITKSFEDGIMDDEYQDKAYKFTDANQKLPPAKRLLPLPAQFKKVKITGPRDIHPEVETALKSGEGQLFRLWDDDCFPVYEGRWISDATKVYGVNEANLTDEEGDPLGDYGSPNCGCTMMTEGEDNELLIG